MGLKDQEYDSIATEEEKKEINTIKDKISILKWLKTKVGYLWMIRHGLSLIILKFH